MKQTFGKSLALAAVASLSLLLSACSSEPTQKDLTQAIQVELDAADAQAKGMMGNSAVSASFKTTITNLEKVGSCTERSDGKTYDCNIKVTIKNTIAGEHSKTTSMAFIKTKSGWSVLDADAPQYR